MATAQGDWRILIRLHPNDDEVATDEIRRRLNLLGVGFAIGERQTSIEDDTSAADAVTTINSSGIMHAVAARIATVQLLPAAVERRLGPPLLPRSHVMADSEQLARWLDQVASGKSDPCTESVLANHGMAVDIAAKQVLRMLGACPQTIRILQGKSSSQSMP